MKQGRLWLGIVLVWASVLTLLAPVAQAATSAAQGIQISPVVINLNADKGKTYTLKIKVQNVTTGELVFTTNVNDFQAKDETGDPAVILKSTLPSTASVITWVQPIGSLDLKAGETKELDVAVTVPSAAEAGGHYGVIRFSGRPPGAQTNGLALSASAGVLLLVRVSGQINESLTMASFTAQQNGKTSSMFAHGPITFVERLHNDGNVHVAPAGVVAVTDMLGHNVGTLKVNPTHGNVLPNSTRKFSQVLNKHWMLGRYKASTSLAYGTTGKVVSGTITFWVIPWAQLLIALAILIVVIWLLRLMIKGYNRRVIKKAQKSSRKKK